MERFSNLLLWLFITCVYCKKNWILKCTHIPNTRCGCNIMMIICSHHYIFNVKFVLIWKGGYMELKEVPHLGESLPGVGKKCGDVSSLSFFLQFFPQKPVVSLIHKQLSFFLSENKTWGRFPSLYGKCDVIWALFAVEVKL